MWRRVGPGWCEGAPSALAGVDGTEDAVDRMTGCLVGPTAYARWRIGDLRTDAHLDGVWQDERKDAESQRR